ncbi:MAG: hypothetical protein R3F61_02580 [Myxococcota bacterium]
MKPRVVLSGPKTAVSNHSTTDHFTPLTDAFDTTDVEACLFALELISHTTYAEVRPAYQFSDDGVTWTTHTPVGVNTNSGSAYVTADGWGFGDTWIDLTTGSRLFVRFGVMCRNKAGHASNNEVASVQLRVQLRTVAARTISGGPQVVPTKPNASANFTPLTGAVPMSGVSSVRGTLWRDFGTEFVKARVAYQVSDDGVTWDDQLELPGSAYTASDGYAYSAGFTSIAAAQDNQFVRFGVLATNSSGSPSSVEFVTASVRIDVRS